MMWSGFETYFDNPNCPYSVSWSENDIFIIKGWFIGHTIFKNIRSVKNFAINSFEK